MYYHSMLARVRPLARRVSECLLDTLVSIFLCIMQWEEKEVIQHLLCRQLLLRCYL